MVGLEATYTVMQSCTHQRRLMRHWRTAGCVEECTQELASHYVSTAHSLLVAI